MPTRSGNPLSRFVQGFYNYRFSLWTKSAAAKYLTVGEKVIGYSMVFGSPIIFTYLYYSRLPEMRYQREQRMNALVNMKEFGPNKGLRHPEGLPDSHLQTRSMFDSLAIRREVVFGIGSPMAPDGTTLTPKLAYLRDREYRKGSNHHFNGEDWNYHRYASSRPESEYQTIADIANIRLGLAAYHNRRELNYTPLLSRLIRHYRMSATPDPAFQRLLDSDAQVKEAIEFLASDTTTN